MPKTEELSQLELVTRAVTGLGGIQTPTPSIMKFISHNYKVDLTAQQINRAKSKIRESQRMKPAEHRVTVNPVSPHPNQTEDQTKHKLWLLQALKELGPEETIGKLQDYVRLHFGVLLDKQRICNVVYQQKLRQEVRGHGPAAALSKKQQVKVLQMKIKEPTAEPVKQVDNSSRATHERFYAICKQLEKDYDYFKQTSMSYKDAASILTQHLGFPVSTSTLEIARKATKLDWESKASQNSFSKTVGETREVLSKLDAIAVMLHQLLNK